MPIELPNLDDRTFADLVEEGRNMIPGLAPSWTDHNPSDPGITLLELFASVTEQLIYRTDRITNEHKNVFLRLIHPPGNDHIFNPSGKVVVRSSAQQRTVDDALAAAIHSGRTETRAITAADYERLACNAGAVRARCLPRSKPEYGKDNVLVSIRQDTMDAIGHVTLIAAPPRAKKEPPPIGDFLTGINTVLEKVTALTTTVGSSAATSPVTLHVIQARSLRVTLAVELMCFDEYRVDKEASVGAVVADMLKKYFDYETGGPEQRGWPIGQVVYASAVYALISKVAGVDYIASLTLTSEDRSRQLSANSVAPACYEYIDLDVVCSFLPKQGH